MIEQRKVRSGPGGSTFRAEKAQAARIKKIVPSSGFKSVSPNGVTSIPDFDSYCEQYQSPVTFEPGTDHFRWKVAFMMTKDRM